MNESAGATGVVEADGIKDQNMMDESGNDEIVPPQTHIPAQVGPEGYTNEEAALVDEDVPELVPGDEESDDEDEGEDEGLPSLINPEDYDSDEDAVDEAIMEVEGAVAVGERPRRATAGKRNLSDDYIWNFLNYSVKNGLKTFGGMAEKACEAELKQLFAEKKALVPVKWDALSAEQRRRLTRSHMFLTEKFNDGIFEKLKARMVADGRTQDRSIYTDYSSPTVKTSSVMTCLKIAATKGW